MVSYILALISAALVLVFDRVSKAYILNNVPPYPDKPIWSFDGIINITHVKNTGGAWGILSGNTLFLVLVTMAVMVVCIWLIIKNAKKSKLFFWALSLVLAGGLGNMYDRIFYSGEVVDFLQFDFWQSFPVFNIADCAIVIGCCLLILKYLLEFIVEIKLKGAAK